MEISENKKFDVIGIGCAAWDLLGIVDNYPQPGDKTRMSEFEDQCGGQVGTALVAVSRLGGKAAIIETTGDDDYGEKIRSTFIREGIDTAYLIKDPTKTSLLSFCVSLKKTGERAIVFTTGTKRFLKPEDIHRDFILNCKCLMVDNHHGEASVTAASMAREAGIPVVTDIERDNPYNDELFRLGTHHILPEQYLMEYTGEKELEKALVSLQKSCKSSLVAVTLGERGSVGFNGKDFIRQSAHMVEPVVDTTGAGDVFHGTFAYGLTLGYDVAVNLRFASLVAGLKCRKAGGQKGIPFMDELRQYAL